MRQLLHDWLSIEMVEAKGISVKLLGREAALAIFMEVERFFSENFVQHVENRGLSLLFLSVLIVTMTCSTF